MSSDRSWASSGSSPSWASWPGSPTRPVWALPESSSPRARRPRSCLAVAYGWYGVPFFGFGHFLVFLFVFVLFIALLRLAFGGGRRRHGYGWGLGHGWGPGSGGPGGSDDPREAWIRARLDEWHRTAHATGDAPTVPKAPDAAAGERLGAATAGRLAGSRGGPAVHLVPLRRRVPSPGPGASNRPGAVRCRR